MAISMIQDGTTLEHVAAAAIVGGEVIPVGDRIGIAHESVASGANVTLHMVGVFALAANANVVNVGQDLYWTGTELTITATANTPAGQCWRVAAGGFAHVSLGPASTPGA